MLLLMDYVEGLLAANYAPAQFKEARFKWRIGDAVGGVRAQIRSRPDMSDGEFASLVRRLFRSPRDIHTSANFSGATAVWLGLHLRRTAEGMVIAWIDRAALPRGVFPFDVGDLVEVFDGLDPDEVLVRTAAVTGWRSTPAFERRFGEWFLTYRASSEWDRIPAPGDLVELVVRRAGEADPQRVTLSWIDDETTPPTARCPHWGKTTAGYLPELGAVQWRGAGAHFPAYVFEDGGERFGYIRVPSYKYADGSRLAALAEFDDAVDHFAEMGVRALVFDQTGNGGGNFIFGFALLSRLIDRPLHPPLQHFVVTAGQEIVGFGAQEGLRKMAAPLATIQSEAAAAELLRAHPVFAGPLNFLPKTLATVRTFEAFVTSLAGQPAPSEGSALTALHYQFQPSIEPISTAAGRRYTGPIVLLIDALNISAAEYVAATLADNQRATLVGVTTAGGGGDQRDVSADRVCQPASSGAGRVDPFAPCLPADIAQIMRSFNIAALSYTITLGKRVRADGSEIGPIENTGVAPHVPLDITRADLAGDFAPYRARVLEILRAAR